MGGQRLLSEATPISPRTGNARRNFRQFHYPQHRELASRSGQITGPALP